MKNGKFGYVTIESHTINALSNNFENIESLRKELYGKPITEKAVNDALKKVDIRKYKGSNDRVGIFMFCPEDCKIVIGCRNKEI